MNPFIQGSAISTIIVTFNDGNDIFLRRHKFYIVKECSKFDLIQPRDYTIVKVIKIV